MTGTNGQWADRLDTLADLHEQLIDATRHTFRGLQLTDLLAAQFAVGSLLASVGQVRPGVPEDLRRAARALREGGGS